MQYRSRAALPEPSTPLTFFDRHAAAAFQSLLDDKPLLEPLREGVYGRWMRPLHAVAVAYAAGGQVSAAARFAQLARRNRGLRTLLLRCAEEPAPKNTLAELLASPEIWGREVVPGLIPPGVTLLAGKPHAGKSWLSLELSLAVASGSEVCGLKDKVLYLALEDPPWRLQRRLHQLAAAPSLPLQFACSWPVLDGGKTNPGLIQLAGEMAGGQRLVVVDTLTAALSAACLASPDRTLAVLARLHALAAAFDAAVLLVDRHRLREDRSAGVLACSLSTPDAVDLAFAAADDAGLFAKTIALTRPFGAQGATLELSDYPRPILLDRHPDLKHEMAGPTA